DLSNFLNKSNYDIIGTSVNGDNIRNFSRIDKGIIVLGNESNGISKEVSQYIDKWISIKKYGNAESLNVAISSAIILDNIRNS
ncbi:MAG: TrmH family RNA methyltransferase, partial [Bacteroidota bacterium]|nr:TrmH family RNA methyltransferase [Bacteroidota bacterium]